MIHITEQAEQELKKIILLFENADLLRARLRLIDRGQGNLGIVADIEMPEDRIVEYDGTKVLVIEPELAKNLQGVTIDVGDTPDGPELVVSEKNDVVSSIPRNVVPSILRQA